VIFTLSKRLQQTGNTIREVLKNNTVICMQFGDLPVICLAYSPTPKMEARYSEISEISSSLRTKRLYTPKYPAIHRYRSDDVEIRKSRKVFVIVDILIPATRCHPCCICSCCSSVVLRHLVAKIEIIWTPLERCLQINAI
jgi:hypothetical protein